MPKKQVTIDDLLVDSPPAVQVEVQAPVEDVPLTFHQKQAEVIDMILAQIEETPATSMDAQQHNYQAIFEEETNVEQALANVSSLHRNNVRDVLDSFRRYAKKVLVKEEQMITRLARIEPIMIETGAVEDDYI